MATLYGLRLLADSYLPLLLGMSARHAQYATSFITYVIPIAGWALARQAIGDGWRGTLRWHVMAFTIFAPIGIASDLIQRDPGSLEAINNILVITGGLNILFNLFHLRRWRSPEFRAIFAGSLIFMLFALNNNLYALGVLPWEIPETPGFLAFVAALGYAAVLTFLRGERARVALEGELAAAREIQRSILPTSMPAVAGLRVEAHYDPASSVAGDLYDFLAIDDARAGVLVADVSGHGVPAALVASMMKIAVSSQSRLAREPGALLREVNRTLLGQVRRAFVTATYLSFDTATRSVEVANAGHPPPLLRRGSIVRELGPRGVLLGRFDAQYESETIALQGGDRVVVYTDGVTEARNARGEEFGEARLQQLVRDGAGAAEIGRAVRAWRSDRSEADDVTLLVIDLPQ
jgi:sigma-B regulation protein RsbU (phosphoserine phosphatase)